MALNSQVILFAIQAAVRLEGQMKSAQIEQIKKHTLNLVTPKFSGRVTVRSASSWFMNDGKSTISNDKRLIELTQKARFDRRNITDAEEKELTAAYIKIRNLEEGHVKFDNINLSKSNIFALTDIKQWEEGTNPNPSPLQRVAGSLVEIGVDYFRNFSHLASTTSTQGKLLMSFLDAIDEVDFAEGQLEDIATSFMTATVETLDSGVSLLGGDTNSSALLKTVAKGVVTDLNTYITTTGADNLLKQSEAKDWGQLIFKSVVSSAGTEVLANPNTFLGTNGATSEMITCVGNSLLNGIMTDMEAGDGVVVSLKNVFTTETLDSVTKASLQVLAEHPEWYELDNTGLQNILTSLVDTVANYPNQLGLDMIPDLTNLILSQTAGNLNLIYQGDPSNPANNLLITTADLVLRTLQSAVPTEAGQKWQPVFTKSQTLSLIDSVMQEVVSNPDWILSSAANANPMLEDVLGSVFKSLQGVSLVGMSTSTKMGIVKSAIETVAVNQGLLEKFNINGEQQQLLNYGIDIVLSYSFGEKASAKSKWALASSDALNMLIDGVLVRLANEGASESVVALTKEFLDAEMQALTNGQGVNIKDIAERLKSGDTLQALLQNSVNAVTRISATIVAENPDLINIENEGVKNIVSYLADAMVNYPSNISTAVLPQFAMMVITQTSSNLGTMVGASADEPAKNLLVMTGETVLNALTTQDDTGKISFNFTSNQALDLMDTVFQQVINNSAWMLDAAGEKSPLLENALAAAMKSLSGVSLQNMTNDTKINVLKSTISAVALQQDLLNKVNIDGQEKDLISYGIDIALSYSFGEKASAKSTWALASGNALSMLIDGVLVRLANEGASESVVALTKEFLDSEIQALTDGQGVNINDITERLKSGDTLQALLQNSVNAVTRISATIVAENPDLINMENEGVKNIVSYLADAMVNYPSNISTAVLPQFAMMVITQTSSNLGTMVGASADEPAKNLLVMTGETVLNALTTQDDTGKISFNFTSNQALDLMDTVFQQVINNSAWMLDAAGEKSPLLEDALAAAMKSLSGVSLQNMTNDTKINVLKSTISAVALRQDLLTKINIDGKETALLSGGIDIALNFAFGEKANAQSQWALMSSDVMDQLIEGVLYRIAQEGASENVLNLTEEFLNGELNALTDGQPFNIQEVVAKLKSEQGLQSLLANSLDTVTRISATILTENPDLLGIQNEDIKDLVTHLSSTLAAYPSAFSAAMLPDLARMIILDTSENIGLIVGSDGSDPNNNLLVQASSIVLNTLLPVNENGQVQFSFNVNQILSLTDDVVQLVVSKPEWILTQAENVDPLLSTALSAAFAALNGASVLNLSNEAKINIMRSALQAVGEEKRFMEAVGIDNELMMTVAINAVMNAAQGKLTGDSSGSAGLDLTPEGITKLVTDAAIENIKWSLSDNDTLEKLSESVLSRLAKEGASEETLAMTNTLIASEVIKIAKGEPFSLTELLAKLESPEQLADIIAAFSNIEPVADDTTTIDTTNEMPVVENADTDISITNDTGI